MAEKSFKVKNSLVVKDIEIDPSGATSNQVLKYNGSKFAPVADGAQISDTPPSSPTQGQMWYESDSGKLFVYYDSFWVEVASGAGSQGPQGPQGATVANAALLDSANEFTEHNKFTYDGSGASGPASAAIWSQGPVATESLSLWISGTDGTEDYLVFGVSSQNADIGQAIVAAVGDVFIEGQLTHDGNIVLELNENLFNADYALAVGTTLYDKSIALFADGISDETKWTFRPGGILESSTGLTLSVGGGTASLSGDGVTITVTTNSAHGLTTDSVVEIIDVVPEEYRGFYRVNSVVSTTEFEVLGTATGSQTTAGSVLVRPRLYVKPVSPIQPAVVVGGSTNQVANLQEWRNDTGTVVASIGPQGDMLINSPVSTGTGPALRVVTDDSNSEHRQTWEIQGPTGPPEVLGYVDGGGVTGGVWFRDRVRTDGYVSSAQAFVDSPWTDRTVVSISGPAGLTEPLTEWQVNSTTRMTIESSGAIKLNNAGTVPSSNNTTGGYLYAENGALKWRGSNGTITTIATA